MKPALFIHAHSGSWPYLSRHWPFFRACGADLFGVSRLNTHCRWPEPIPVRAIGDEAYIDGDNQCRRIVDTYRWFVDDPRFADYSHAWIVQGDVILLGHLPTLCCDAAGHPAGNQSGYSVTTFYHPPWVVSRDLAPRFVACGDLLLLKGINENGIPDFFFPTVCKHLGVAIHTIPGIFSVNSGDFFGRADEADAMIQRGGWYLHGIKTIEEFEWVLTRWKSFLNIR